MESPVPHDEHKWLQRLLGNWTFEGECSMGPDQPPMKNEGTELVKPLGELWTVGHMSGPMPDGSVCRSLMTLGYDPLQKQFVGTFVTAMSSYLWIYNGALDASGQTLTLDCEGPSFTEEGKMAQYQDIIEFIDENHRILRSQFMGPDGQWVPFMKAMYTRAA